MNYVNVICEMLKVEQNQPFKIKEVPDCWYRINNDCETEWDAGTNQVSWYIDRVVLMQILSGDLTIEALEKQIPKKYSVTEYETFNGGRLGVGYVIICSICKNPVHDFEFCPHCGQKIDWA